MLLALCLLVCLVGASIYAKATFLIFLIVTGVLGTILVSFFATRPISVPIRLPNVNGSEMDNGSFTGFSLATLRDNLGGEEKLSSPCLPYPPWHRHLHTIRDLLEGGRSLCNPARSRCYGVVSPVVCVWGH